MFATALLLFKTCVGVHVLALHVEAVPAAAVSESVYPAVQLLQSTCSAVSQNVPALPSNNVGVPFGQVQILEVQTKLLNWPFVPQVAVPPPE